MAPDSVPRNYRSASILLPDARVWSVGGGLCYLGGNCDKTADHPDGQIFSPPCVFTSSGAAATRPIISALSSTAARVRSTITVTMSDSNVVTFALLRLGSATHSTNSDQRRVPVSATRSGSTFTIKLPSDSGALIPGSYYLFALSSGGTPSVARTLRITL